MGIVKTFLPGVCIAIALAPVIPTDKARAEDLSGIFADCAGRYAAEREHAWLMAVEGAEAAERRVRRFADLLGATAPAEVRAALLDRRIRAKLAHAQLLQQADLSPDPAAARWARLRAERQRGACEGLLLDS